MACPAEGYSKLAQMMGDKPEMAILRRFSALSAETLLYLQADLVRLEDQLHQSQNEDKSSSHRDRTRYHLDWTLLRISGDPDMSSGNNPRQLETIREIKTVLKEYYEMLVLHESVLQLRKPDKWNMKDLREWMSYPNLGHVKLIGDDEKVWNDPEVSDLLNFGSTRTDAFTCWVTNTAIDLYHGLLGRHIHKTDDVEHCHNSVSYTTEGIASVTRPITILTACMLPIAAIALLCVVKDMTGRLWIVAIATGLFSLAMSIFTTAEGHDIFSATAAFAAVLVVFVGTTAATSA